MGKRYKQAINAAKKKWEVAKEATPVLPKVTAIKEDQIIDVTDEVKEMMEAEEKPIETPNESTHRVKKGEVQLRRAQAIYGLFILRKELYVRDVQKELNMIASQISVAMSTLKGKNLITAERQKNIQGNPILYTMIEDAEIPEGWPSREEMMRMSSTYERNRPTQQKSEEHTQIKDGDPTDNPLTYMIKNSDQHLFDVSGYEQFLKDTSKMYGIEELDAVIGALHEICKQRIANRYIECPLCHGRLEKDGNEVSCPRCDLKLKTRSFKETMEYLKIIADNRIEVL